MYSVNHTLIYYFRLWKIRDIFLRAVSSIDENWKYKVEKVMGDVKVQSTNQLKLQNITYELPQNKHTTAWDQKTPTSD